ncbi:MAG: MerR family transcriptional regulator [Cyanobacteria bacterium REEB65]|nr:MerR family transcriptional regulator [Cyanobacteria bacterium REEB65]
MNISAAATALGVSPETLRQWDQRIPALAIPRDPAGRRRFEDRHLAILRAVKGLQDEGRTLESIRVILEPPAASQIMANAPVGIRPDPRQRWLRAAMTAAHDAAGTRADALDRARSENSDLRHELLNLKSQIADLERQNGVLAASLASAEDRIQRTELMNAFRQIPTERPWWRFWN